MSTAYVLDEDWNSTPLERIMCKNEDNELQRLLLNNHDLLPGDQISPHAPSRWLLVKREMSVDDPETGKPRWSIDFFFVDQSGIPTLVECKRFLDPRSRRAAVGQILEYAANGHAYWTAEELQGNAQDSAKKSQELDRWLREDAMGQSAEQFFATVVENLREARMRLVIFLEHSPSELRSLVEFLNSQLKNTDVLIVEARQFDSKAGRIVVPRLLGFSEQARIAKLESRQVRSARAAVGEASFRAGLEVSSATESTKDAVMSLLDAWDDELPSAPFWDYRTVALLRLPGLNVTRCIMSVTNTGDLELAPGYWDPAKYGDIGERQVAARNAFMDGMQRIMGLRFPSEQLLRYPKVKAEQWVGKQDEIISLIDGLVREFSSGESVDE